MKKVSSFEIIGSREGSVAIVEIKQGTSKSKEKEIAKEIMKFNKSVKTVLKKTSKRKTRLRTREYQIILGDKDTEVIHKEHGYRLKLDIQKTYFSPRESTERLRISKKVKPKENVLVMFGGVAPLAVAIARRQPKVQKIYSIELNRSASKYAKENIKLNKISDKVEVLQGDVNKICPRLKEKFDRILMPLPQKSHDFLGLAVSLLKKNGVLHVYSFSSEKDMFSESKEKITIAAKKFRRKIRVLRKKKVLPYAPRIWKIVLDVKVY